MSSTWNGHEYKCWGHFFFFLSTRHIICMQQRGSMDSAVCTDTRCCGVVLFRVNMFQTILIVLQNLWFTLGLPLSPRPSTPHLSLLKFTLHSSLHLSSRLPPFQRFDCSGQDSIRFNLQSGLSTARTVMIGLRPTFSYHHLWVSTSSPNPSSYVAVYIQSPLRWRQNYTFSFLSSPVSNAVKSNMLGFLNRRSSGSTAQASSVPSLIRLFWLHSACSAHRSAQPACCAE